MRKLFLIAVLMSFSVFGEEATPGSANNGHDGAGARSEATSRPPKLSLQDRLQRFVSACSNGRITLPGATPPTGSNSIPFTGGSNGVSPGGTLPGTGSSSIISFENDGSVGAAIFNARCLVCHSGKPQGPIKNFSDAVSRVISGTMPKIIGATITLTDAQKQPLTEAEKTSLIAYLKTRQ